MIDPITDYILNEQYDVSAAISAIRGAMNVVWTDCFEGRCMDLEKYDKKLCKSTCKIASMNAAISKLNSAKSGCRKAGNPESCINRLNRAIEMVRSKISNENEVRTKIADKRNIYRRKAAGGA